MREKIEGPKEKSGEIARVGEGGLKREVKNAEIY